MQFKYEKKLGDSKITFTGEFDTEEEVFQQLGFFMNLPEEGPSGEGDLRLEYRKTKEEGYEFYSLLCPSAKKEIKFGQLKSGGLFKKSDWEPVFGVSQEDHDETPSKPSSGGLGKKASSKSKSASSEDGDTPEIPTPADSGDSDSDEVLKQFLNSDDE